MINYTREKEYLTKPLWLFIHTVGFATVSFMGILLFLKFILIFQSTGDLILTKKLRIIFIVLLSTLFHLWYFLPNYEHYKMLMNRFSNIANTSNKFQTSFNTYKLLGFDLRILSIKTSDGKDIRDFGYVYMSELKNYYKYHLEIEDYPDSKFVIERHNYRSNYLIDAIIEIYLNESPMGLRYNSKDDDLRFYQPIEKRNDEFNLTRELCIENIEVIY